ncbi:hypothetical protein WDW86_11750 [Bdellovibrionota bacterium FG-2]
MSLKNWRDNGWLRGHETSAQEVANLLGIVERDLEDAEKGGISDDWRFGIAYNAALKLCSLLLYASGYRPEKNLAHYRTLLALPEILGLHRKEDSEYLDKCREKRNIVEYDYVGVATQSEADELIEFAKELRSEALKWLAKNHPKLLSPENRIRKRKP